jgi:hypothetical protein
MERKRTCAATQLEMAQDVEHGSCGFLIARKRLEDRGVKFSSNLYAVYTRRCGIRNSGFTGLVAILHQVRGSKMRTVPDVLCLVVLGGFVASALAFDGCERPYRLPALRVRLSRYS